MPASHENDFERADGATHRRTATGVLSTYKKQLNLSAKDLVERDYWKQVRTMRDQIKEKMEKTDHATYTKNFVTRLRLGKDLDAPMSEAGDDYGDYSKFESDRNSVVEKNALGEYDDGSDPFLKNYNKMMTEMANYEGDQIRAREDKAVNNVMSRMDVKDFRKYLPNNDMLQEFMNQRLKVDWKEEYIKF